MSVNEPESTESSSFSESKCSGSALKAYRQKQRDEITGDLQFDSFGKPLHNTYNLDRRTSTTPKSSPLPSPHAEEQTTASAVGPDGKRRSLYTRTITRKDRSPSASVDKTMSGGRKSRTPSSSASRDPPPSAASVSESRSSPSEPAESSSSCTPPSQTSGLSRLSSFRKLGEGEVVVNGGLLTRIGSD
eukprot:TRINITY_DN1234_c0_g1_i1.p1 TRINITY_DN1234_c0_g1~~TRINITY_DN1234_c0_g1_i1.p1  ORF type:complete len:188 (-),score=24.54 TRINITY_DN1234_c0_g1_i1:49-612(-)